MARRRKALIVRVTSSVSKRRTMPAFGAHPAVTIIQRTTKTTSNVYHFDRATPRKRA